MKTTHYVCDRCEADISGGPRSHLRPSAGAVCDRLPEGLDLCTDCLASLLTWLDGPEGRRHRGDCDLSRTDV